MSRASAGSSYDLVIVGASFSGLVCARTAAMRGLRVCVLETKRDPGARIHTTGILVKEAADEVDLPHGLMRRVHGVRLYAPNLKFIDLFAPGSYFLTTRTADLMRWLADLGTRAPMRPTANLARPPAATGRRACLDAHAVSSMIAE